MFPDEGTRCQPYISVTRAIRRFLPSLSRTMGHTVSSNYQVTLMQCPTHLYCQKHACLEALVNYAKNPMAQDNISDQPVFIQELSTTLENAFSIRLNSVEYKDSCELCQIAHKINQCVCPTRENPSSECAASVTELARLLQIHESSLRNMPGAFTYSSRKLYLELEKDCYSLIRTLKVWKERSSIYMEKLIPVFIEYY